MKNIKFIAVFILFTFVMLNAMDSTKVMQEIEEPQIIEPIEMDTLQLESKGNKAILGVVLNNDLTFETAERKGWKEKYGALIGWVTKGSAAEKSGIQSGDIITSFDGHKVLYNDHLRRLIKSKVPVMKLLLFFFAMGSIIHQ